MKFRCLCAAALCVISLHAAAFTCDRTDTQIWITPNTNAEPLLTAIADAKQSIDIAMYDFTDFTILKALISAKYRGVTVNVLMEPAPYQESHLNDHFLAQMRLSQINTQFGNPSFQFTHEKMMLVDGERAFISTGNFTYGAFETQRNVLVEIDNPALLADINQVFWRDWQHEEVTPPASALMWGPEASDASLVEFIQGTRQALWVYAVTLSDPDIIRALVKKAQANVPIYIITNQPQNSKARQGLRYLTSKGIQVVVYPAPFIHAKVLLRDPHDPKTAAIYVGSSNLSYTSLHRNRELGVFLCAPSIIQTVAKQARQDSSAGQGF